MITITIPRWLAIFIGAVIVANIIGNYSEARDGLRVLATDVSNLWR